MPSLLPLRPELVGAAPYGAPHPPVAVRLNVNENPYPPPPAVVQAVAAAAREAAGTLNRYPDRDFTLLRGALAEYLGREADAPFLTAAEMWAANGSNEVMVQVLQAFGGPGRTALSFAPTYSMYPEYARDTNTRWAAAPRAADFSLDTAAALAAIESERPSVILLASPNNPTGASAGLDQVRALAQAAWDPAAGRATAVLVVDEAYAEFRRPGAASAVGLIPDYPHLAVARTMSKAFAFAGARLGYLAAQPPLVQALRTVRLPYHLSSLTQAAALAALAHAAELQSGVAALRVQRDRLAAALGAMANPFTGRGLDVAPTDANFALFGVFPDRHAVWEALLARGVVVRETGPDGWLRVSAGTPEQTDAFLTALAAVLKEA
ncbi:MAG: histidinol-phosphate transaminase [Bifidobacteriaceae bacterium]|nr:histidinol-phosphate transaminase [Bifidobacteriaceae bacterium]